MTILKTIKLLGLLAVLAVGPLVAPKAVAQPGVRMSEQVFYNELSPYGQWVPSPNYGSVWIPNVEPDFQPYATGGHWVVTEFGNTWVSDYVWGWAPFHYGRWYFDDYYGWAWVPGPDWGPAWVSWRSGGGYYGWAPLGPGIDINLNINIPAPYWTFVPQIYITSPRLYSYCVPRPRVVNIYQNTTIINNIYRSNNRAYVYGPQRYEIERVTRRSVPVYRIDNLDRPGRSVVGNGSVGFYRPNPAVTDRREYGRRYDGRNNRYEAPFNNPSRPDYNGNNAPSRGYYNGDNTPNRNYNGNTTAPNRGNYGGTNPSDRRGGYLNSPSPTPEINATPDLPNRLEPSRGGYSPNRIEPQRYALPDNSRPGNYRGNGSVEPGNNVPQPGLPQRPNRSFERPDFQSPRTNQPIPETRSESSPQRMPENRGRQFQPRVQESGQPDRPGRLESLPGGGGRGPR